MSKQIRRPNGWTDHDAARSALQEQPDEWVLIGVRRARYSAANAASDIRCGRQGYTPAGAYEARAEPVGDDTGVYARYVDTEGGEQR